MAARLIKRGAKKKTAATTKALKAMVALSKSDARDLTWNTKHPDEKQRVLFTGSEGVGEAMGTVISRCMAMKGIVEQDA